jgi:CheY-like chemotaxis protein
MEASMSEQRESARVLIVDDDDSTRESFQVLLRCNGYEAATACNGADALRQLRRGLRPRLILLEILMPEKNGWQFRVEQVLDPELETIPVVVYSGDAESYADAIRLGAVARFLKPVPTDQLLNVVRTHCGPA